MPAGRRAIRQRAGRAGQLGAGHSPVGEARQVLRREEPRHLGAVAAACSPDSAIRGRSGRRQPFQRSRACVAPGAGGLAARQRGARCRAAQQSDAGGAARGSAAARFSRLQWGRRQRGSGTAGVGRAVCGSPAAAAAALAMGKRGVFFFPCQRQDWPEHEAAAPACPTWTTHAAGDDGPARRPAHTHSPGLHARSHRRSGACDRPRRGPFIRQANNLRTRTLPAWQGRGAGRGRAACTACTSQPLRRPAAIPHSNTTHITHAQQQPAAMQSRLAFACYFLLGCGVLAPWNAFITGVDYYGAVFPVGHRRRRRRRRRRLALSAPRPAALATPSARRAHLDRAAAAARRAAGPPHRPPVHRLLPALVPAAAGRHHALQHPQHQVRRPPSCGRPAPPARRLLAPPRRAARRPALTPPCAPAPHLHPTPAGRASCWASRASRWCWCWCRWWVAAPRCAAPPPGRRHGAARSPRRPAPAACPRRRSWTQRW
jgi:hypothetical protein